VEEMTLLDSLVCQQIKFSLSGMKIQTSNGLRQDVTIIRR
jgi:hypothetical protein